MKRISVGARLDRLPIAKWHYELLIFIGLGLFVDGIDNYMGSAILSQLVETGWSNNYLNATFISFTMIGLMFGSLFAGYVGDRFGRKFAYQINLLIFGCAALIGAFSPNMHVLLACRLLMGLGLGAEIVVGFGTFAEFLPARERGRWASFLSLIGNCAGPFAMVLSYFVIPIFGWRVMFIIGGVSAILVWIMRHNLPESPRWYEVRGEYDKADKILDDVEKKIELERNIKLPPINEYYFVESDEKKEQVSWQILFKKFLLKRTVVAASCLIAMNTLIYTIINWLPTIFVQAGISVPKSVGMTAMMMLGAPVGVYVSSMLTDKFPRKYLAVGLLFFIAAISYVYSLQRSDFAIMTIGFFMTVLIYFFVCFSCSVYVPELFPTEIRLSGMGIANAIGRMTAVLSPYGVAWLLTNYGPASVFEVLSIFIMFIAAVILILGVETRGKTLEDLNAGGSVNHSDCAFQRVRKLVPTIPLKRYKQSG